MNDSEVIELINKKAAELRNIFREEGFAFTVNLAEVQFERLIIESQKFVFDEKIQDFFEYLGENKLTSFIVMKLERVKKRKWYKNLNSEVEVYFRFEYLLKKDQKEGIK